MPAPWVGGLHFLMAALGAPVGTLNLFVAKVSPEVCRRPACSSRLLRGREGEKASRQRQRTLPLTQLLALPSTAPPLLLPQLPHLETSSSTVWSPGTLLPGRLQDSLRMVSPSQRQVVSNQTPGGTLLPWGTTHRVHLPTAPHSTSPVRPRLCLWPAPKTSVVTHISKDWLGHPGGSAVEPLPSAQGVIPGSWDQVPHPAPCIESASPSACVSASCVSHE